jgi:trimethylamine--corrinoid protein Co-methyltransferase
MERELSDYFVGKHLPAADASALDAIEKAADRVLEEIGIRFQNDPETIEVLRQTGAETDGDIVRLDGNALRQIVRKNAPSSFRLRARNPKRDTVIGGSEYPSFAPIYGAPDVLLESGKRVKGTRDIYHQLVSIAHETPGLTNTGHMICVMDDVPEASRPLEMLLAHLALSDKPFMGSIASPEVAIEYMELTAAAIARPPEPEACNLVHLLNCSPPLTFWENPLKCLRSIAQAGECAMVSSYMMMGATSPSTIAGTIIQGYAEVLSGLALTQLWRVGAPVVVGILGFPFDMRSMLPNFGDPASQLVQIYSGELARRLGIPFRGDGAVTSAKLNDAQAGSEGARGLAGSITSGANFILHSAGWLEQGRCVSVDKLRRDGAAIAETYLRSADACEPPTFWIPSSRAKSGRD